MLSSATGVLCGARGRLNSELGVAAADSMRDIKLFIPALAVGVIEGKLSVRSTFSSSSASDITMGVNFMDESAGDMGVIDGLLRMLTRGVSLR